MFKYLKKTTPCLPEWWIPLLLKYSRNLLVLILCATGVLLFFTIRNFKVNTDLTGMLSNDLPFRQVLLKFHEEFPRLVRPIVVVVEGNSPEQARQARNALAGHLRRENTLFSSVYAPGDDPFFDKNGLLYLSPEALEQQAAAELHLKQNYGITISITGTPVVNYDDMRSVRTDITLASLISFVLVGIILYLGLGSFRLVFSGLATLMTGLVWTIGFAILVIGQLNMISVTFVVLFIGLGIDFSIQISLRYKEFFAAGKDHGQAIAEAVNATFNTLLICTISTAIGFYVFVPTAYIGVSELGLISGTGMFFILFANLTMLPTLMNLIPAKTTYPVPFKVAGQSLPC